MLQTFPRLSFCHWPHQRIWTLARDRRAGSRENPTQCCAVHLQRVVKAFKLVPRPFRATPPSCASRQFPAAPETVERLSPACEHVRFSRLIGSNVETILKCPSQQAFLAAPWPKQKKPGFRTQFSVLRIKAYCREIILLVTLFRKDVSRM
jgi:hypothetical protein